MKVYQKSWELSSWDNFFQSVSFQLHSGIPLSLVHRNISQSCTVEQHTFWKWNMFITTLNEWAGGFYLDSCVTRGQPPPPPPPIDLGEAEPHSARWEVCCTVYKPPRNPNTVSLLDCVCGKSPLWSSQLGQQTSGMAALQQRCQTRPIEWEKVTALGMKTYCAFFNISNSVIFLGTNRNFPDFINLVGSKSI